MNLQSGKVTGADVDGPSANTLSVLAVYWQIFWRRKWIVAAGVFASLLLAVVAMLAATPIYSAGTRIEISRQEENIVQVDGVQPEATGIDQEFYQTQYALLESRALMDRVAEDLDLANDPAFVTAFDIDADKTGLFSFFSKEMTEDERQAELSRQVRAALDENSAISPLRGSRIVDVFFSSPDPDLSARIANAWVEAFIASSFDRKLQSTTFATTYLQSQLEEFRSRLESSERDLVNYANQNRIITVNSGAAGGSREDRQTGTIADANLASLNEALAEVKAARINAESQVRTGNSPENLTNDTLTKLRGDRATLAANYARLMTNFQPDFPEAKAVKSQLDALDASIRLEEGRIRAELGRAFQAAQAEESRLAAAVEELKQENLDQRRRGIQYNIYQREVDTNRELYDGLLQRFKEIGLAAGIGPNNISIVDVARPPQDPSSPSLINNLIIGLAFGLLSAAGIILILEQFDRKVRNPAEAEKITGLPVLGAVPNTHVDSLAHWSDPKSELFEAYMSIQTSLRLATESGVPKSLMVTSTGPGEGKSLTCLSLARALRSSGKTVAVLDADLRRPSVHTKLGLRNEEGLSEYLAGQAAWPDLMVETEVDGIEVMMAGTIPPNPTELLAGDGLLRLIGELGERFDHVFIDSPPLLGLADAPLIAEKTGASIYVIEANSASDHDIQAGIARLSRNAKRIVGVVLTKYEPEGSGVGYGANYAYNYSYEARTEAG